MLEDVNEGDGSRRFRFEICAIMPTRPYGAAYIGATSNEVIGFGHTVTFERDDGRTQTFRIVGEDEANPSQASISHGSPAAIALTGKTVGDVVQLGPRELEILSIS